MTNETNCEELAGLTFIDCSFTAAIPLKDKYEFTMTLFPVLFAD